MQRYLNCDKHQTRHCLLCLNPLGRLRSAKNEWAAQMSQGHRVDPNGSVCPKPVMSQVTGHDAPPLPASNALAFNLVCCWNLTKAGLSTPHRTRQRKCRHLRNVTVDHLLRVRFNTNLLWLEQASHLQLCRISSHNTSLLTIWCMRYFVGVLDQSGIAEPSLHPTNSLTRSGKVPVSVSQQRIVSVL